MKRLLAMLLAVCMLAQPLPGSAVTALGAETEGIAVSGAEGDFSEDAAVPDAEGSLGEGAIEEISPGGPEIITDVSGGEENFVPDAGAATDGEDSDVITGGEIIDEIDIAGPVEGNASEDEAGVLIEEEADGSEAETELLELGDMTAFVEAAEDPGLAESESAVYDASSSYIEVRVAAGQSFIPEGGLNIQAGYSSLDNTDTHFEEKTLMELGDTAVFEFKVVPGNYKVTVNAEKYECYEQTIAMKASQRSKICVSTARSVKTEGSSAESGWLRLGDVKGDGKIDQADIDTIRDVIFGRNTTDLEAANLNKGLEKQEKVDIADLQIAVQNKNKGEQKSSVEVQQIPLPPETEAGVKVQDGRSLNDLISGDDDKEAVTLGLEKGSTISPQTPVTVSFALADENAELKDLPMLGGMTIQSPVSADVEAGSEGEKKSGIESGWLEVESFENSMPVIYLVPMTKSTNMDEALKTAPAAETEKEPETAAASENSLILNGEKMGITAAPGESDAGMTELTEAATKQEEETNDVSRAAEEEQTQSAAGTETGLDLAGDTSASAVNAGDEEPVSIDMGDVVLGDSVELVLDGTDSVTVPDLQSVNAGNGAPVSGGMNETVPGEEDVVVILDDLVPQGDEPAPERKILAGSEAKVTSDGSIVMNFKNQVPVKKVTIKITGTTKKEKNLVDISKVEFINDMESRIPEPELNIPKLTLEPGNEEITAAWEEEANVTGYELEISGEVKKKGKQKQTVRVAGTKHTFTGINGEELRNFKPYQIRARFINGEWRSEWSGAVTAIPKPDARPEPVDNLTIKAGYKTLSLNWKDMDDANGYMVFYREESEKEFKPVVEGSGEYQPAKDAAGNIPAEESEKSGKGRITANSYQLTGLGNGKLYYVYVIGWNELGWGSYNKDRVVSERTEIRTGPQLPKYHAINLPESDDENAVGVKTPHIESAECSQYDANPNNNSAENDKKKAPRMVDSKIDGCAAEEGDKTPKRTKSALGVVDNDYDSYWQKYDWDDGVSYEKEGIKVKLDKAYEMSYLTYSAYNIEHEFAGGYVERVKIRYRNTIEDPDAAEQAVLAYISRKYDVNGQMYYLIKFQKAVKANEIRINLGRGSGDFWMRVGEIRFHECDEWYDGIMGLFADEMHSSLREGVTAEELAKLEAGLETTDHGEKHPLYDSLKLELELAKKLFEDREKEQTVLKVDTRLTTNSDSHLKFGGLNAWQPLGRVVAAGEMMVIYVAHDTKRAGESCSIQAVFTQYHAQSNELVYYEKKDLKVGRNEFTVPQATKESRERGGQVYIQYTGARNSAERYEVRALGGQKIPVLNIYKMKPGDEKTAAVKEYVKELDKYVKTIHSTHDSLRPVKAEDETAADEAWKKNVDFDYTDRNCLLNATDLMMDYMMYSVPALQVWKGITENADINKSLSDEEVTVAAKRLETSLDAMEDTMKLFYQHKGLSDDPKAVSSEERGNNEMPVKHLNIRYMQMFAGAFMYASGNHIGIEYPETNVAGGAAGWDSFGWGIGHEIGHDINQSCYAIAEITNNYFAQLLTKAYNGTRFKYEIDPNNPEEGDPANDIYSKVTSGALGRSANGAVQLGLYWQLHLAFDNCTIDNKGTNNTLNDTISKVTGKGYKYTDDRYVFDDYDEQFSNLFFARVDTYARNPKKAPHGGVELASGADAVDQNLMRLACAAANADILSFFERWGMVPNEGTLTYAANFAKTEKALYYVNDDARDYRAAHTDEAGNIKGQDVIESAATKAEGNKVSITITPKSDKGDVLLGYEILRTMYSNGKPDEDVVGFKLADGSNQVTYIDEISTINNRVMYYKVRAVDKYLNYSKAADAGSEKIQTNGALNKSEWTIETTMTSADDVTLNPNPSFDAEPAPYEDNGKDDPDGGFDENVSQVAKKAKKVENSIDRIADGSEDSAYTGTNGTNAGITIDMHNFCKVTSLIYRGDDLGKVTVSVSTDKTNWTVVKAGKDMSQIEEKDGSKTIWFDAVSEDGEVEEAWIGTYKARYVKLAFSKAGEVTIKEIDICGPSGDNVEFETAAGEGLAEGQAVIGVLKEDYKYSNGEKTEKIPEGSLIFTGRYKGNPAYNVVILYDEEENVIGGHVMEDGEIGVQAEQIIFAKVPEHGELGETSDGIWVYYLEPEIWKDEETLKETVKGRIRGELYRVDHALTNEGERIVSDTKFIELPEKLPKITLVGGGTAAPAVQETEGGV